MAVIGRIRRYSGLLLAFVGVALAAFVMGDLFQSRVRTPEKLAEINGERISFRVFGDKVDEQLRLQEINNPNQTITSTQRFQIMDATWTQLLNDMLVRQQCEEVGLAVASERHEEAGISPDELLDQIQGDQPHPFIVQNFTDPNTGQLNRQMLNNFVGNLEQLKDSDPETYAQWVNLENMLSQDRLRQKYLKMIESAFFVPDTLAHVKYVEQSKKAECRYLGLRITTVADSLIKIDDDILREYYDEHKQNYKQEASRELKYVQFDILPSERDISQVEDDIASLRQRIDTETDDIGLFNSASDIPYDSTYMKKGELSPFIDSLMFSQSPGFVTDVYYENNSYRFAKLMGTESRPDSIRFSHIFIAFMGSSANTPAPRSKEQAEVLADSLLTIVKRDPTQFEVLASQFSDDTESKNKGGDLDWMKDPGPVNKIINTVVDGPIGMVDMIEADAGYHVIKITGKTPLVRKVRVAIMARNVSPSESTFNQIYSKASDFAASSKTLEDFTALGNEYNLRTALVREMDMQISVLEESRPIIRWAFEVDREEGNVSDVFELGDKYVVAAISKVNEKGITPFEDKKADLEPLVKNELKSEYLVDKLAEEMQKTKDIYALASKFQVAVDTNNFINFASTSLPGYGPEPEVIGTLFTLKPGEMSGPIKGVQGAFVVILDTYVEPEPTTDYSTAARIYQSTFTQRVQGEVLKVLKDEADLEDNRRVYY